MSRITQKGATGPLALHASGTFQTSTDANLSTLVGTRWDLADGREVILVSVASTSTCTAAHLMQDAPLVAAHQTGTVVTFTSYSSTVPTAAKFVYSNGATALTANQYAQGFAVAVSGTGIGQTLRISSNTAAAINGTTATFTLEDSPNVAFAAGDIVSLLPPHGQNVIYFPTTATNVPVGIGLYNIGASSYGFLVSKGITAALSDATVATVMQPISASTSTAGAVTVAATNASGTGATFVSAPIGYAAVLGVSAQTEPVFVNL